MSIRAIYDSHLAECNQMLDLAKAEKRELTPLEQTKYQHMLADLRTIKPKMEAEAAFHDALPGNLPGNNFGGKSKAEIEANAGNTSDALAWREKYNHYLRTGETHQLRNTGGKDNYTITTGTDSGALVPVSVDIPDIIRRLYNSFLAAVISRGQKPIMTATAETLIVPIVDDTTVFGDTPSESASSDTEVDPTITNLTIGATLFSSKSIWVSNTMIATIGYDLLGYLLPLLDKRVELAEDGAWVTKLLTKVTSGNTFTTASTTAFTYLELVKLYHTLNPVYRTDAVWIVSDGFLQAIRSLVDSEGRPLFNMLDPLLNAGAIGYLMGCPVFISTNMPTIAANHYAAFFGSAECLKARYVTNRRIARYTNIPTFPDQVGFRLFENADIDFNPAGLAFLKMGAS